MVTHQGGWTIRLLGNQGPLAIGSGTTPSALGLVVATSLLARLDAPLMRNTLKMGVAALLTAAIAVWSERIEFVWYPLMAVVIVVDDNDDQTIKAASSRILGTITGGLVTFLVHTLVGGWQGVLLSLLLMVPVLRALGWQSALGTAGLVSVMFLMVPSHADLNWQYVFNRALDTVVGCVVALGVSLLFWPRSAERELDQIDARLLRSVGEQLDRYSQWQRLSGSRPNPLNVAALSADLERLEALVNQERSGPRHRRLQRSGWVVRLGLWRHAHFHWIAWERLLQALPPSLNDPAAPMEQQIDALRGQLGGAARSMPRRDPQPWQVLAKARQLPLLPLLALEEEWRQLHAGLGQLGRGRPC